MSRDAAATRATRIRTDVVPRVRVEERPHDLGARPEVGKAARKTASSSRCTAGLGDEQPENGNRARAARSRSGPRPRRVADGLRRAERGRPGSRLRRARRARGSCRSVRSASLPRAARPPRRWPAQRRRGPCTRPPRAGGIWRRRAGSRAVTTPNPAAAGTRATGIEGRSVAETASRPAPMLITPAVRSGVPAWIAHTAGCEHRRACQDPEADERERRRSAPGRAPASRRGRRTPAAPRSPAPRGSARRGGAGCRARGRT